MYLNPFTPGTRFYRGNLHGHSTHSDGLLPAAEIAALYRRLGYDFTCLSDHLHTDARFAAMTINDTRHLNRDDFITIISAELHCGGKTHDKDGLWHILANGLPLDFACADADETAPDMVQRALDAGAFVSIAHPEWHCLTMAEAESIAHAHAVEVLNHSCAITSGRGSGVAVIDWLLNEGFRPGLIATDDSHTGVDDVGGGWVMVAADSLNAGAIITALKAGRYYASSGAEIHSISLDGTMLEIHCSAAHSVIVAGAGHRAQYVSGESITRARFDLKDLASPWFRIIIQGGGGGGGDSGGHAWTNAYFMADLMG